MPGPGEKRLRGQALRSRLLLSLGLLSSAATGAPPSVPTPDWSSDQVRAARSTSPTDALIIDYKREVTAAGASSQVESGSITLARDFVEVASPIGYGLDDFALCRSLNWRDGDAAFANESCYAGPAVRLAELANRRVLRTVLETAMKGSPKHLGDMSSPYWAEQELAVQETASDPLVVSRKAQSTEWRLGRQVVVRTSGGFSFSGAERKAVERYFARHLDLHPQVRQALLEAGNLPERLMIERRQLGHPSTEVITFSNPQRRSVNYPLPPHLVSALVVRSQAKTTEGAGLRQALLAVAGTAKPPKPSLDELMDRIRTAVADGRSLEAFLQFLALSQQYGGELQSDPAKMEKLRRLAPSIRAAMAAPEVAEFNLASNLAGSAQPSSQREAAARYLAGADQLDKLTFGTFRYVTFANLVRTSSDATGWDKSIASHMPSLADCYWTHIAAYPWASPAFKDLGDFWYTEFDTARAWQAWDLGRAVDPGWRGGPMQAVADLESRTTQAVPGNF